MKLIKYKIPKMVSKGSNIDPNYAFVTTVDTDTETDITSIVNIATFGERAGIDYCLRRLMLKTLMNGSPNPFSTLTDEEKNIIIDYCATDDTTIITHYMMQGMTQMEATVAYIDKRAIDVRNAADCYYARLTHPKFTAMIMLYLGATQGETLMDAIRNFASDVKDIARVGTNYGNVNDGILDYIEGTGSYVGGGLENYVITPGLTLTNLRKSIKDHFYYGYTT